MNEMPFPLSLDRVTWRDAARARRLMIADFGFSPNVLLLGEHVKISLWSRLFCRFFFGLRVRRAKS